MANKRRLVDYSDSEESEDEMMRSPPGKRQKVSDDKY